MKFWYSKFNLIAILLLPLSFLFFVISFLKRVSMIGRGYKSSLPVICVGNIVVGGSGKTPVVMKVVEILQAKGLKVAVVSRGYKSELTSEKNVVSVSDKFSAKEVGDEPLMIWKKTGANVYICSDRSLSARQAEADGCDVIVMDDGMQNFTLKKDFVISVFNGNDGVGNGWLLPAGFLRESIFSGAKKIDLAIFMGEDKTGISSKFENSIVGKLDVCDLENSALFDNKNYIAFAGIGKPQKFFDSLDKVGLNVVFQMEFEDHYSYSENDIERLIYFAKQEECSLITTEKDLVKISKKHSDKFFVLPVEVGFSKADFKRLEFFLNSVIVGKNN